MPPLPPLLPLLPLLLLFSFPPLQHGSAAGNSSTSLGCPPNQLACRNDTGCYPKEWSCDGVPDCADASDEMNCTVKQLKQQLQVSVKQQQLSCTNGTKMCRDKSTCIDASWWCDKFKDCPDGSDETNCTAADSATTESPSSTTKSPSSTTKSPSSTTKSPSSTNEHPSSTNEHPSSTSEHPSSTNKHPSSTNKHPSSTNKHPSSTNKHPSSTKKHPNSTKKHPNKHPSSTKSIGATKTTNKATKTQTRGCGPPPQRHGRNSRLHRRIFGGQIAKEHSWPWMVSLRLYGGHFCGGSIYSESWIITAAHCAECDTDPRDWQVDAGRHCRDCSEKTLQRRTVVQVVTHPNYNVTSLNCDIALMKVDRPFQLNSKVSTVCLPPTVAPSGTYCFVTGWGVTKGTGDNRKLLQAMVPIVPNSICGDDNHYGDYITQYMLCAGYDNGGKDACQGDSGGPLVCQTGDTWFLQGVTSWGAGCGLPRSPGVYTRVQRFINWIANTTDTT